MGPAPVELELAPAVAAESAEAVLFPEAEHRCEVPLPAGDDVGVDVGEVIEEVPEHPPRGAAEDVLDFEAGVEGHHGALVAVEVHPEAEHLEGGRLDLQPRRDGGDRTDPAAPVGLYDRPVHGD